MFGQRPGGGGNTAGENGRKFPYTVETITIGGRLVLTADEENVKAILATQFADYGKGPQFRKEWKDFLGLSRFFLFFSTSSEIYQGACTLVVVLPLLMRRDGICKPWRHQGSFVARPDYAL